MKNQRGITQGWLYLIGLVALLIAIGSIVVAVNRHDASVDKKGYDRGKAETEKRYQERDNQQLREVNDEIQKLQTAARAAEAEHQKQVSALSLKLSKELKANETLRTADRDAIRNGDIRLRDPGARSASAANCSQGAGTAAVGTAGGSDATAESGLSAIASEFLLDRANLADAIVAQLDAAQALIVEQVRTCNSGP
jgi:hypothetical protein